MPKISRSARTGKFVTKAKAKRSPNTTVTEKTLDKKIVRNTMKDLWRIIEDLKRLL